MVIEEGLRNTGLLFRSEAVVVGAAIIRPSRALNDVNSYIRKAKRLLQGSKQLPGAFDLRVFSEDLPTKF